MGEHPQISRSFKLSLYQDLQRPDEEIAYRPVHPGGKKVTVAIRVEWMREGSRVDLPRELLFLNDGSSPDDPDAHPEPHPKWAKATDDRVLYLNKINELKEEFRTALCTDDDQDGAGQSRQDRTQNRGAEESHLSIRGSLLTNPRALFQTETCPSTVEQYKEMVAVSKKHFDIDFVHAEGEPGPKWALRGVSTEREGIWTKERIPSAFGSFDHPTAAGAKSKLQVSWDREGKLWAEQFASAQAFGKQIDTIEATMSKRFDLLTKSDATGKEFEVAMSDLNFIRTLKDDFPSTVEARYSEAKREWSGTLDSAEGQVHDLLTGLDDRQSAFLRKWWSALKDSLGVSLREADLLKSAFTGVSKKDRRPAQQTLHGERQSVERRRIELKSEYEEGFGGEEMPLALD